MSDDTLTFAEKLQDILSTRRFEALEPFKSPANWQKLTPHDKELLAQLFVTRGKELLSHGDSRGIDLLDRAIKIAGNSAQILYSAGQILASQKNNLSCLSTALHAFEEAMKLEPQRFDIAHAHIQVLLQKGIHLEEIRLFEEALEFCRRASSLLTDQDSSPQQILYWDWAKAYFFQGKYSGEALDFNHALEKYTHAAKIGLNSPDFWRDFGDVYFELAQLLGREDYCLEAIERYQLALKLAHDCGESWLSLACCYTQLYENFGSQEHFTLAQTSFINAAKLDVTHFVLWLKWGQLELESCKQSNTGEALLRSLEKFERASLVDAQNPLLLCSWGEALMLQGNLTEDVSKLKEAEKKISASIPMQPDNYHIWHLYGCCYNELGKYFNDESYYQMAIEKFQHGLSINKNSAFLWHGLAFSHFALGELTAKIAYIEKACHFCSKAIENGAMSQSQCWNDWGVALMKIAELTNDKACAMSAIEKFENALNIQNSWRTTEEGDTELLYNYGCALDFVGDFSDDGSYYEKAIHVLHKVLQNEPKHPYARYNFALALSHLGELASDVECMERAVEQFELVLQIDPEDDMGWNELAIALINLAQLVHEEALPYKSQRLYEQAETKLHHAINLGNAQAYYTLACFNSLMGNLHGAMFYLEKAESYRALPSLDEIMRDEWLNAVKETPDFHAFLHKQKSKNAEGL